MLETGMETTEPIIREFAISISNRTSIFEDIVMTSGAVLLSVAEVRDVGRLWAETDPTSPVVKRRIFVIRTGEAVPANFGYVGTIVQEDRTTYHIYDGGEA